MIRWWSIGRGGKGMFRQFRFGTDEDDAGGGRECLEGTRGVHDGL
jgi:hypothetical protein